MKRLPRAISYAPIARPVLSRQLLLTLPADRPGTRLARFAAQSIVATVGELVARGIWAGRLLDSDAEPRAGMAQV